MRLVPPEPEIRVYKEGFGTSDLLGRQALGKQISQLVERLEDPFVLAVNGPWGSGKSFFLKRWVGAHELENDGTATTVYFDAFLHDYLEDPLLSLTGAIGERIPRNERSAEAWEMAKAAASKLVRPAARIGLALASGGLSELTGPVGDAVIGAARRRAKILLPNFGVWKMANARQWKSLGNHWLH